MEPRVPDIPTETNPHPVPRWPAWVWWRGEHGWPYARCGQLEVHGRNWTELLARIRKAEGESDDGEAAQ